MPSDVPEYPGKYHEEANPASVEALEELRDVDALESRTLVQLKQMLDDYGLQQSEDSQTQGWAHVVGKSGLPTSAYLVTTDSKAVYFEVGPKGEYKFVPVSSEVASSELAPAELRNLGALLGIRGTPVERLQQQWTAVGKKFEGWMQWLLGANANLAQETVRIREKLLNSLEQRRREREERS